MGATLTFVPPDKDFNNLDHEFMYAWNIQGLNTILGSESIIGAQIKITNIYNWDTQPNRLFMHLLDSILPPGSLGSGVTLRTAEGSAPWTAYEAGTVTKVNGTTTVSPLTSQVYELRDETSSTSGNIQDDFAQDTNGSPSYYMADGQKFLGTTAAPSTAINNTPLGVVQNATYGAYYVKTGYLDGTPGDPNTSFAYGSGSDGYSGGQNYTYTFTSGDLDSLRQYIANNGDIAFGIDPDCHFFNDGFQFIMTTGPGGNPVPEPATLTLLGTALAGLAGLRQRRKRLNKTVA